MKFCIFIQNVYEYILTIIKPEIFTFKDLFYTFLSALLGLVLGYFLTKHFNKQQIKQESRQLRKDLAEVFKTNIKLISQCVDQLENKKEVPNYLLDVNSVNFILLKGKPLFSNTKLYTQLNQQRYQLEHLNSKLSYFFNLVTNTNKADAYVLLVSTEKVSLLQHLSLTKKEIESLLEQFSKEV